MIRVNEPSGTSFPFIRFLLRAGYYYPVKRSNAKEMSLIVLMQHFLHFAFVHQIKQAIKNRLFVSGALYQCYHVKSSHTA